MVEPEGERVIEGIAAAEGLAVGPIVFQHTASLGHRAAGSPLEEREALNAAMAEASREIGVLVAGADKLAAEILEFQGALLEDEDLLGAVLGQLDAGGAAHDAWAETIDGEVAEYRAGDDEYFRARAEDLLDLKTRVLRRLHGAAACDLPPAAEDGILVAEDLTPSRFLELDWSLLRGAAIQGGSPTSHVAILARARGIPLVVGLDAELDDCIQGAPAVLDAKTGRLVIAPNKGTLARIKRAQAALASERCAAEALVDRPAVLTTGDTVQVLINVDDPAILEATVPAHCDGIGLTRTEFLFRDGHLPGEDAQFEAYRRLIVWAGGRSVTIRTLDAGGDKPIPGVTPIGETNPFLGVRGLRLSLQTPALFAVQLRALARAAALGPLKVMVPMVTVPQEMDRVRALLNDTLAGLAAKGVAHARPALGMMVEVPVAAMTADRFDVDFFSIGSNDLVQYLTACARDNPAVAPLADPRNPAVLELIRRVVEAARAKGVEVSLCGDMASDPDLVPLLLDCGLRSISVAPALIGRVKLAIQRHGGGAG